MPESKAKRVKVQIPIRQGENRVRFPNRCICCGELPTRAYKLSVQATQEEGQVRKIFASKAYLRTLAGVKKLISNSHMSVPYCKDHFAAAWIEKWVFRGVLLISWLAGMSLTWNLFLDTFLAEGYWAILLFVIALFGGWVISGVTLLLVQRAFVLVHPVIKEIPANMFNREGGPIAGTSIFSKDLLGITVNPKSISMLEIYLDNPAIANEVQKLNTGTPDQVAKIEAWPDPISMPAHSAQASGQPQKTNALALTTLILGLAAVPMALCIGVGALFGLAALITGGRARRQIRDSSGKQAGEKMVLWGMILGGIGILLGSAIVLIIVAAELRS